MQQAGTERKLIVALDFASPHDALRFWEKLALPTAIAKVGLELIYSGGVNLIREFAANGVRVFVDAKLFDIGNTVERATARIAALGAEFVTIHVQDPQILAAAVRGRNGSALKLLGITVLTSMSTESLASQGISIPLAELVRKRASDAADAGFDGVVCSPHEAREIKTAFGKRLTVVCPGIRPAGGGDILGDDQARAATPFEAAEAGADFIVVGRPILRASDPALAARRILEDFDRALHGRR
jgi:orotidine-5'-phosphate decarboxylase